MQKLVPALAGANIVLDMTSATYATGGRGRHAHVHGLVAARQRRASVL